MQLQITITRGIPKCVVKAFKSQEFASAALWNIIGNLGVEDPHLRPAEYNVAVLRSTCTDLRFGVMARLVDVSRDSRELPQLKQARLSLHHLINATTNAALAEKELIGQTQTTATIVLDREITKGSGKRSNLIEGVAHQVDYSGVWPPQASDSEA